MPESPIAVIVGGLARTLNTKASLENFRYAVATPLQPDVFLAISKDTDKAPATVQEEVGAFIDMLAEVSVGYIGWKRFQAPKLLNKDAACEDLKNHHRSQFYGLHGALKMMETVEQQWGYSYSAVIRTRTDVVFERVFPQPAMVLQALAPVQMIVPWVSKDAKDSSGNIHHVVGDQTAVMTREAAPAYFSAIDMFACGPSGEDLSAERSWCSDLGWDKIQAECIFGHHLGASNISCFSTFAERFDKGWEHHMVEECPDDETRLCMKVNEEGTQTYTAKEFVDGEPGKSFTPKQVDEAEMMKFWRLHSKSCKPAQVSKTERLVQTKKQPRAFQYDDTTR